MRAKRPVRVLLLLLAVGLLPTALVLAHHAPTVEDVVSAAGGLGMGCETAADHVDCFGPDFAAFRNPVTTIYPATGPLDTLYTQVDAHTNGSHDLLIEDRAWFTTLHAVGCADNQAEHDAVAKFMDALAAQFAQSETGGTYGPFFVGECSMVGHLVTALTRVAYYDVTSNPVAGAFPTPTPTPSPTPTVMPTASPTPTPSPSATAKPTSTPSPTATPTPTPTPTPNASDSSSVSASESPSASETATASPSATPEQSVKGETFSPEPSVPEEAPDEHGVGGWPGSIPGAGDVSTKPADVGSSALAAALMLVAMGFIGELFNNTTETNYYRIVDWWKKSWVGRIGRGLGGLFGGGST